MDKDIQVSIMGSIYQSAQLVAACLGLAYAEIILALRKASKGPANRAAIMACLEDFDQIPYLNWTWIKQEIILPRKVIFFCGTESISWKEVKPTLEKATAGQHIVEDEDESSESEDESDSDEGEAQDDEVHEAKQAKRSSIGTKESAKNMELTHEAGLEDGIESEDDISIEEETRAEP